MIDFEQIKQDYPLLPFLEGEIDGLRRSGSVYKARCPFHTESTPSFAVYPDSDTWRCYGACSEGGDIFDFVEKKYGYRGERAKAYITGESEGIARPKRQVKREASDKPGKFDHLPRSFDVLETWHENLMSDEREYAYALSRVGTDAALKLGMLGTTHGLKPDYLNGLLVIPYWGPELYDGESDQFAYKLRSYPWHERKTWLMIGRPEFPFMFEYVMERYGRLKTIFIVEGELDALLTTGLIAGIHKACAANTSAMKKMAGGNHIQIGDESRMVILADNDENEAGLIAASELQLSQPSWEIHLCPDGHKDIGDYYQAAPDEATQWIRSLYE